MLLSMIIATLLQALNGVLAGAIAEAVMTLGETATHAL